MNKQIIDFAMWLTTRPKIMKVGAAEPVYPMHEAIDEYLKLNPNEAAGIDVSISRLLKLFEEDSQDAALVPLAEAALNLVGGALTDLNRIANALETLAKQSELVKVESVSDGNNDWYTHTPGVSIIPQGLRRIEYVLRGDENKSYFALAKDLNWADADKASVCRWRYVD